MAKTFQKDIVTHQLTLTIANIASVVCWVVCYLLHPVADLPETIGAFALYALIGYLLIIINKSFAIIRLRASFQTVIFLILVAICPAIHTLNEGIFMTLCCLGSIFITYSSYHIRWSAALLFHAFMIWSIGGLFVPKIVWLIPYIWYSCYVFRSLNLRSFVASIFGWSIPAIIYVAYDFLNNGGMGVQDKVIEMISFEDITSADIQWPTIITLLFLFIIYTTSVAHYLLYSMDEKVQTRCYLQHLTISVALLFVLAFTNLSSCWLYAPLILVGIALLYGHFSTLTNSKWSNIFFIGSLICSVPVFVINLIY